MNTEEAESTPTAPDLADPGCTAIRRPQDSPAAYNGTNIIVDERNAAILGTGATPLEHPVRPSVRRPKDRSAIPNDRARVSIRKTGREQPRIVADRLRSPSRTAVCRAQNGTAIAYDGAVSRIRERDATQGGGSTARLL